MSEQIVNDRGAMKPALQKRSREKAERMMKVGNDLIERNGYDGMRISDLARKAECSVGIFYDRFKDKEGFFQLLLASNAERSMDALEAYLAPELWEGVRANEIIGKVVQNNVNWFRRHRGLYCAAMSTSIDGGNNFTPFRDINVTFADKMVALLRAHEDELHCEDLEETARFAIQMISGTLVHAVFSDAAKRAGSWTPNDKSLTIDDAELVVQLTKAACMYLGIDNPDKPSTGV